jgi:predicted DNA-binding antitoxin AbrB/MazE fold protein
MAKTISVVYDGKTLKPLGPLDLEEDRPYEVTIEELPVERGCGDAWGELDHLVGTVEAPRDWAEQHDHYLYGSPKHRGAGGE